ncbi:unnamed protein product [Caenorhabditis angaria]|uniref:SXP/RAL-2 family protein Ani s 5-like cation-binding domain-containing protein n=1 Tax=Caenorhabditis angaria TaxID=860376 RepID=A0A9P1IF10_9PELO|nr:unnamed protein product [Caenorhabditis angaria]
MRHHLIFVFVFLIHLQLITSLTPQKVCEGFLLDWWKYWGLRDANIFHADYKKTENGIDVTEKFMNDWMFREDSSVKSYIKKYENALENKDNFWEKYWDRHIARFTADGLLELKTFSEKSKLNMRNLMIPDPNMQGGYKMFKQFKY